MQTSFLGKIRYNVRGEWSSLVSYVVDDIVTFQSTSYKCIQDNTNQLPLISTGYWEQLSSFTSYMGEWNSSEVYYRNNIVEVTTDLMYDRHYNYQDKETYILTGITSSGNFHPSQSPNWKKISSGNYLKKYAWLGGINEGHVPTYKKIWDAKSAASPGGVGIVSITNGGSGYTTSFGTPAGLSTAIVTFSGGSGTGASAVSYVSAGGTIFNIEITDPGQGYTNPVSVTISGGGGSSATATAFTYTNKVGVGDTVGQFKGSWHNASGTGSESLIRYINRNYGLMQMGNNNATYNVMGTSSNDADFHIPSEATFIHLDWYEGLLPTPDGLPPKVIQVEGAVFNNLVLFNNGEVHYTGYNGNGNAGDNTTTNAVSYVRCGYARVNISGTTVLRGKKAIRIASSAGGDQNESISNYALIENGDGGRELYSWGYNGYGQLAHGDTTDRTVPTLVSFSQVTNGRIIEIWATGGNYVQLYVLTDHGKLFACGYNTYGQLGDGSTTNRSSLVLIKNWFTATRRIERFICVGGETASSAYVIATNTSNNQRELWSWGYNGYGQLGHNHTFLVTFPIRVNTGGYSGVTATVTTNAGAGTTVGAAFTNVYDVWGNGSSYVSSSYISVGSSVGLTTALATGYNGYRHLSLGLDDTTNRSIFTGMQINSGAQLTNLIDVQSATGTAAGPWVNILARRYNGEWYAGGYNNSRSGVGHGDSYNVRQVQDPNYIVDNYRLKNNILWQQPFDQNYIRVYTQANTSSGQTLFVNLKTGQVLGCITDNTYGSFGFKGAARQVQQSLLNH
jgi:hypothetical protein